MRAIPRLLYFFSLVGLAVVAVLALNGAVEPSLANTLLRAVIVAALCGAPGLIHRKLWPLSLVLLPLGAYLLIRTTMPVPALADGAAGQYHFYVEQLRMGADAYLSQVFPLDSSNVPGLELLLAFSVYWLVGAAAFVSLSLRGPIPGMVLLLVLLGFGLTVDGTPRAIWSALLFLVLAACFLVLGRSLDRTAWTLRDILAGGSVGVVASLLALLLLVAVPSAAATPWQDWRTWDPFGAGVSTYTFNWLENYPYLLNPTNDKVIMKVESTSPSYWRANALERFTGSRWDTALESLDLLEPFEDGSSYVYSVPEVLPRPPGEKVTQTYTMHEVNTAYLFVGGDPLYITMDQELVLRTGEARAIRSNRPLGPSLTYSATAVIPSLQPEDLVDKGRDYPSGLDRYRVLPFSRAGDITGPDPETREARWREIVVDQISDGWQWENLYALNQELVGDATDPYDITINIEKRLRRSFAYSLDPPRSDLPSPFAAFLFDHRTGYCQHFAGAMALLLRYNDIPARVAVGFATGEEEGSGTGIYTISTNNAHAWVEVYFPDVGWVAFDPTPAPNNSITPTAATDPYYPGFINPFRDSDPGGSAALPLEPPRQNIPEDQPQPGDGVSSESGGWLARAVWLPWVVGLTIVLVSWPFALNWWRKRRLHRGTPKERFQTSLALLRRDMSDYGLGIKPSHTLEDALSILDSVLHIDPDPRLVARADAVLFGGYPAREADLDQAETLRRTATARLRRRRGWVRTALTWYGVPRLGSLRSKEA